MVPATSGQVNRGDGDRSIVRAAREGEDRVAIVSGGRAVRDCPLAGAALLVVAVAVLTHVRVVGFGFAYDDHWTILQNDALRRPLGDLLRAMARGDGVKEGIADSTRPLMVVGTWIDRRLWGGWAGGYHLHSLLLHGVVSGAALFCAFALTRRRGVALVAASFFAVAPIHAEAIAAVNYREDLYAAFGTLVPVTWLFWPRRADDEWRHAVLVAAAWAAGLGGKESAIVLVPLLAAAAVIRRPGWAWLHARERTLLALGAVLVIWSNWRIALMLGADDVPRASAAWGSRLADLGRFEARAVLDTLFPFRWSPEWPREDVAGWTWLAVALGLTVAAIVSARRRRTRSVAIGLAVAMIAPLAASPLVSPANPRADRYLYVAVLGAGLVWAVALDVATRRLRRPHRRVVLGAIVLGLAGITQPALSPWRSELDLWRTATERAPDAARAWAGLSRARRLAGDLDGAERAVARAIEIDPRFVPARVTRAYALLARGRVDEARSELAKIRELGGADHRGVARAERCAALAASAAPDCIRPAWQP